MGLIWLTDWNDKEVSVLDWNWYKFDKNIICWWAPAAWDNIHNKEGGNSENLTWEEKRLKLSNISDYRELFY